MKELIKGFQVARAELEAMRRNHPAVKDAAVLPIPDARAGELPKAYAVPAQDIPAQDLIDYVAARVAPYKQIRDVAFVDAIPTSPSGKRCAAFSPPAIPSTATSAGSDRPVATSAPQLR